MKTFLNAIFMRSSPILLLKLNLLIYELFKKRFDFYRACVKAKKCWDFPSVAELNQLECLISATTKLKDD